MYRRTQLLVGMALAGLALGASMAARATPLVDAAERGTAAEVRSLLKERQSDVNGTTADGSTALLWAVYRNDADMTRALLAAKADANAVNRYGMTPLLQASRLGNLAVIESLLDAGADLKTATRRGETPVMAAAGTGNAEAIKVLVAHGADVNAVEEETQQSALMWAAGEGHVEAVRALLAAGANPNFIARPSSIKDSGRFDSGRAWVDFSRRGLTALMFAAREGHFAAAEALVKGGADPTIRTPDQLTAMMIAVLNDGLDLAAMLLEHGADPDDGTLHELVNVHNLRLDATAADVTRPRADHHNEISAVQLFSLLLEKGADPGKVVPYTLHADGNSLPLPQANTQSAYVNALRSQDVELLRILLDREQVTPGGAVQKDGATPLMTTITGGGIRLNFGQTVPAPFREPAERSAVAATQLLLAQGADVNESAANGDTALHRAAQSGDLKVIRELAAGGASLEAKNSNGFTPLDLAMGKRPPGEQPVQGLGPPRGGPKPEAAALLRELTGLPAAQPKVATASP